MGLFGRDYVKRASVAGLTGIFKPESEADQDADKLVDLFRNRVELKKEFAALRNEKYELQGRIKEHRGSIERVEQKLQHLRLAAHCQAKVERFAEELKQQREQRGYAKLLSKWKKQRQKQTDEVQALLGERRMRLQLLVDQLQGERHKLSTMGGVSRMFHARQQEESIGQIEASITAAQAKERKLLAQLARIEELEPPPAKGLDIEAKRSINFMVLAFVQQLYLQYADDNLAALSKESIEKSVGAINYGGKAECDGLLEVLARRRVEVEQATESPEILKKRARLIAERAVFRNNDDAVPAPGTVATLFDIDRNGAVCQSDANILGENYFGVAKVMSR
jgi:chromosome segregation ATPase